MSFAFHYPWQSTQTTNTPRDWRPDTETHPRDSPSKSRDWTLTLASETLDLTLMSTTETQDCTKNCTSMQTLTPEAWDSLSICTPQRSEITHTTKSQDLTQLKLSSRRLETGFKLLLLRLNHTTYDLRLDTASRLDSDSHPRDTFILYLISNTVNSHIYLQYLVHTFCISIFPVTDVIPCHF